MNYEQNINKVMGVDNVHVYVVSAFSKNGKGGNAAGVVLDGAVLTRMQKMQIAKKLGYAETAFVTKTAQDNFKLAYFTPADEVPLCGHATIAAFTVMRRLHLLERPQYFIETKAGNFVVEVGQDGLIMMQQRLPVYGKVLPAERLEECFQTDIANQHLPIQIVSTGLCDIMFPVGSVKQLASLSPDFSRLAVLSREERVVGVHAFALRQEGALAAVCRNFAPLYGIDEEAATGTSNCALACYLFRYGMKKTQYVFEQGREMGQTSRIIVNLTYHEEEIDDVFVGGYGDVIKEIVI